MPSPSVDLSRSGSPVEGALPGEHTCGEIPPRIGAPAGRVTLSDLHRRCDERPFGGIPGLRVGP